MFTLAMRVREGSITDEEIRALVSFTLQQGGIAYAEQAMTDYASRAMQEISELAGRSPLIAESLSRYTQFVLGRDV